MRKYEHVSFISTGDPNVIVQVRGVQESRERLVLRHVDFKDLVEELERLELYVNSFVTVWLGSHDNLISPSQVGVFLSKWLNDFYVRDPGPIARYDLKQILWPQERR